MTHRAAQTAELAVRLALMPEGRFARPGDPEMVALAVECELASYAWGQLYCLAMRNAWHARSETHRVSFARAAATAREAILADACTAPGAPPAVRRMASAEWRRSAVLHEGGVYQGDGGEALRRARAR